MLHFVLRLQSGLAAGYRRVVGWILCFKRPIRLNSNDNMMFGQDETLVFFGTIRTHELSNLLPNFFLDPKRQGLVRFGTACAHFIHLRDGERPFDSGILFWWFGLVHGTPPPKRPNHQSKPPISVAGQRFTGLFSPCWKFQVRPSELLGSS